MYKVFVGCLPASCTVDQLKDYFSKYGQVEEPKVARKAGSKLCSGNATFGCQDKSMYDLITSKREFEFQGRTIYCEGKLSGSELLLKNLILSRRRIYVSNLPPGVSDPEIELAFSLFGPVQNGYRIKTLANKPRPYGFVTFMDDSSADKAIRAGSLPIQGQYVYISPFKKNSSSKAQQGAKGEAPLEVTECLKTYHLEITTENTPISSHQPRDRARGIEQVPIGLPEEFSRKARQHIKPTSVCYHKDRNDLEHHGDQVRFNIKIAEFLVFHPVSSKETMRNQTTAPTSFPGIRDSQGSAN